MLIASGTEMLWRIPLKLTSFLQHRVSIVIGLAHPKSNKMKAKKTQKPGREGTNPLIYCCKRYIITTAAAVHTESDHTKKPQINDSLKRKKNVWVVV